MKVVIAPMMMVNLAAALAAVTLRDVSGRDATVDLVSVPFA